MRCPHCGHQAGFLSQFHYRADGGCRCASCRNVFYVDAVEGRWRFILLNISLITLFTFSLFQLLRLELMTPWIAVAGFLVFMLAMAVSNYLAFAKAHTVIRMPSAVLWRRRCFNYGMLVFAFAQFVAILSRPYVPADDWTHYIQISGSVALLVFILVGRARRSGHVSDVISN